MLSLHHPNCQRTKNAKILENWMHHFSHIRNICAHHSRLWNRRPAIRITLPKKTLYNFIENKNVYPHKIYPSVCAIIYVLNIIEPSHHFVNDLKKIIHQAPFPAKQIKEMGFPKKWEGENFWK